jgi:diaminohydroxyphosphoribosylaminopyrimidine deaminase/5-amino-6-(5-phosphoribosylamino)uracil reductase
MIAEQWNQQDRQFMAQAIKLARRGLGKVEPNPAVGAVIVKKDEILGQGYHHYFGGPHAEVDALYDLQKQYGRDASGATLYVTLEPCCHFGKTPPCTQAIIRAGIKRVVVAAVDPSAKVAGKGIAELEAAGIEVQTGLFASEAEKINAWFFKFHRKKRPWVLAKWAQTLDGKLAARTGHAKWITGPQARQEAHRIRQSCQAVVVGIGTVLADDPELTVRLPDKNITKGLSRIPNRVILDSGLRIKTTSKLVQTAEEVPTWVFTSDLAGKKKIDALRKKGVHVEILPVDTSGKLSLPAFLKFAARQDWPRVMVEGGPALLASFLAENLVDEIHLFQSGMLALDEKAYQLNGQSFTRVDQFINNYHFVSSEKIGDDITIVLKKINRKA